MSCVIKKQVVGIDIGVNVTTIALVDIRGTVLAQTTIPTGHYPDVSGLVEAISQQIITLAQEHGGYESLRSIGVSAPSGNYKTGCIENAVNMPWKGIVPLAALLRDRTGLAVAVGNDAHATAMGEYVFGAAHGMKNFIVASMGHGGLGSCFFSNGHANLGQRGSAGEIGHSCVIPDGRLCNCGRKGCVEAYVTPKGIAQTAKEMLAESDEPSMLRSLPELTALNICSCCEKGDPLAKKIYEFTGELLGRSIANYASLINPEAVILTGMDPLIYKCLEPALEKAFEDHVFPNVRQKVKLVFSCSLDDSERDVLGASALAWTVKEYSLFL